MNTWILVVAGVMALGGVVVAAMALFRDRSRGRRRCPRCWYEMAGVSGLKCPECGRTARNEKKLLRTRRRYGRAGLGVMMVVLAGAGVVGQRVREVGWVRSMPTVVLIAQLPSMHPRDAERWELGARIRDRRLRRWEVRWLIHRSLAVLRDQNDTDTLLGVGEMLQTIQWGEGGELLPSPAVPGLRVSDVDCEGALAVYTKLVEHSNAKVRNMAVAQIRSFRTQAASCATFWLSHIDPADSQLEATLRSNIPVFTATRLRSSITIPDERTHFALVRALEKENPLPVVELRACGRDESCEIRTLLTMLGHDKSVVRLAAIWALQVQYRDRTELQDRVYELIDDPDVDVRRAVVEFAAFEPLDEKKAAVVRHALEDDQIVGAGLNGASLFPGSMQEFGGVIEKMLVDERHGVRAAVAWLKIGGDPEKVAPLMFEQMERGRRGIQVDTLLLHMYGRLGKGTPEVLAKLSSLVQEVQAEVRVDAAFALAKLGGDRALATRTLGDVVPKLNLGYACTMARERLHSLAITGEVDLSVVRGWLESDNRYLFEIAVQTLMFAGASAAPALDKLRELQEGGNSWVDMAVRTIEWELRNPAEAAVVREERRKREELGLEVLPR